MHHGLRGDGRPWSWWTLEYVLSRVRGDCHTCAAFRYLGLLVFLSVPVPHNVFMHNPRPASRIRPLSVFYPAPERVLSGPRSRLKKYCKLLLKEGDFMHEFNLIEM